MLRKRRFRARAKGCVRAEGARTAPNEGLARGPLPGSGGPRLPAAKVAPGPALPQPAGGVWAEGRGAQAGGR